MFLHQAHVVLGITGGIAAYKSADLASKLVQAGAQVDVVMTKAATHFVGPLTFQALTGRPVHTTMFRLLEQTEMAHLSLAWRANVLVIAPATANTLAKLAHGIADNLLCATALASSAPLVLAPAMDAGMWEHPSTQENLEILRRRGAILVGPGEGRLASGRIGCGRLAEVPEILGTISMLTLAPSSSVPRAATPSRANFMASAWLVVRSSFSVIFTYIVPSLTRFSSSEPMVVKT